MLRLRKIVRIVLILLTATSCFNQIERAGGPIDRSDLPIKVSKIRGSVYLVEDYNYWKTNTVFFADKEGIVFVDGTWTTKTARQILWKAAVLSEADYQGVIVTSFPLYRTGGLWEFHDKKIPIYMHKYTPPLLRSNWVGMQNERAASFSSWQASPPQAPDFVFDADLKFLGGRVTAIYPGPAHTADNSVVYFPEEKVLYGGTLLSWPPHFLRFAKPGAYASALKKIRALDFDTIIAGHGQPRHGRELLDKIETEMNRRARSAARKAAAAAEKSPPEKNSQK